MPASHPCLDAPSPGNAVRSARGVGWVLSWAFSLAVFAIVSLVLSRFAVSLIAERTLMHAAQAGVTEATLPRATQASVQSAVRRHLAAAGLGSAAAPVLVARNGMPVTRSCQARTGDRLTVAVAVPSGDALPEWLARATSFVRPTLLAASAERTIP